MWKIFRAISTNHKRFSAMKKDRPPHPKQQVPFIKMVGIYTLTAPKPHLF